LCDLATGYGRDAFLPEGDRSPGAAEAERRPAGQDRTTGSIFGEATIDGAGPHVFLIEVMDGGDLKMKQYGISAGQFRQS
jgi:hypothetical protein